MVKTAGKMADTVVLGNGTRRSLGPFHLVKGLAEHRRDHLQSAIKWMDNVSTENESNRELQVLAVTAMAQFRLGETNTAATALAKANATWPERLIAHSLLREAKAMMYQPEAR